MSIEPRRWWSILSTVPLLAGVGAGIAYRTNGEMDSPPSSLWFGAGIGAGLGVIVAVLAYFYYARHDSRRLAVARELPHALVVQAQTTPEFFASLGILSPGVSTATSLVTVAFEPRGVSFWAGLRPEQLGFVPAADLIDISVGVPVGDTGRVKLVVKHGGEPVEVLFGVERIPLIGAVGMAMTGAQVVDLAKEAKSKVSGGRDFRSGLATSYTSTFDHRTVSPTAWKTVRTVRRASALLLILIGIDCAAIIYSVVVDPDGNWWLLGVVAMVVIYIVFRGFQRSARRAAQREREAGYTTVNTHDFDLQQLHPFTGRVIRLAGAAPLSRQEFERLLGMA